MCVQVDYVKGYGDKSDETDKFEAIFLPVSISRMITRRSDALNVAESECIPMHPHPAWDGLEFARSESSTARLQLVHA